MLYNSRIVSVTYSLTGGEAALKDSFVPITSYDLYRNGVPVRGGLADAHLGTPDPTYRCQTCFNSKKSCLGHEGHYVLKYPVLNPMALGEIRKWLRIICFKCGNTIVNRDKYAGSAKPFELATKLAKPTTNRRCDYCFAPHPIIRTDVSDKLVFFAEIHEDKKVISRKKLYPRKIGRLLGQVTDTTVRALGRDTRSHPRNFVLDTIKIPPITIRPDTKNIDTGRNKNDDITNLLHVVIRKNAAIPAGIVDKNIDPATERQVYELNSAYYNMIKGGADVGQITYGLRLRGKMGRFRRTMMGKRVRNMCRSTIIGIPTLRIDQVMVPLSFARTIQFQEIVQDYNRDRISTYLLNGRDRYPGCSMVWKKSTGERLAIESLRDREIENGDVIYRDMITGDPVNYTRQPSLEVSNISGHYAVVCEDPSFLTLGMNVLVTPYYNADFDGDQMNLIILRSVSGKNEVEELSSCANWVVSYTKSSPALGQVDDSIIGLFELTRDHVRIDKYSAMLLFANTTLVPEFTQDVYTGREIISLALSETPINYRSAPSFYDRAKRKYIRYSDTEIETVIEQGKLLRGVLDGRAIKKEAHGGIYHIIANEYGHKKSLEVIFNMQQIAIGFVMQSGYTIGLKDLVISDSAKESIDKIAADMLHKSEVITSALNRGELVAPIDKTVEQWYEEQQIGTLQVFDDFADSILGDIDHDANNLYKLIASGSKGKIEQLYNMVSAVGQKLINGERIRQRFGYKRTLPYTRRYETDASARGYIINSYINGMTLIEYICNAMCARFDLIAKSMSTSITGTQSRKSIKTMEGVIVNNYRWCLKAQRVIQVAYGEDFLDPRFVEKVKFPTVKISDDEFAAEYLFTESHASDAKVYRAYSAVFAQEFATLTEDRNFFRGEFLKLEEMTVKEPFSDEKRMPVNVARVILNLLTYVRREGKAPTADLTDAEILEGINTVAKFVNERLPYVLLNEIQEKRKMPVPEHMLRATRLMQMLVRSNLCARKLQSNRISGELLSAVLDKIYLQYSRALIDPGTAVGIIAAQAFTGPLTQYMLDAHHRSALGGTTNAGMVQTIDLLGAKSEHAMTNPTMLLVVDNEDDLAHVRGYANKIEMMKLDLFVSNLMIFFEKYGRPTHPLFAEEATQIAEFNRLNPLLRPPADLIDWCIRFSLDQTTMILKNMSVETIVTKLRDTYPDMYFVYTQENSPKVYLRVYMRKSLKIGRNNVFKGGITTASVLSVARNMLAVIIRGVDRISSARVDLLHRHRVMEDGSIARVNGSEGGVPPIYAVYTQGTNMRGVASLPFVRAEKCVTDAVQEIARVLGIEAARAAIGNALRNIIDSCNYRHYQVYADVMTNTGVVTPISKEGLSASEPENIGLRIGFASPMPTLEEASAKVITDKVSGITSPLIVGSVPRHGTLYNSFQINEEMVPGHVSTAEAYLEEL